MIALPNPDAVPANSGLIDNIPAVALGMVMPLPNPTNVIKPKKAFADPKDAALIAKDIESPKSVIKRPQVTIVSIPKRVE